LHHSTIDSDMLANSSAMVLGKQFYKNTLKKSSRGGTSSWTN